MSNPGWHEGMPEWNRTTECEEWTNDWIPCKFPYTGLSGYNPDPDYCYDTFAESSPGYAYKVAQLTYAAVYFPLLIVFANRVLYVLVDLKCIPFRLPLHKETPEFTRKSRIINVHDQCNIFSLCGVVLQLIRLVDLHSWKDILSFEVNRCFGRLVRSLILTTGVIIIKIWMNLISFWTTKSEKSQEKKKLRRDIKVMNFFIFLTWMVLFPLEMYSILYTRSNCQEGCVNAEISCISGIVISVLTMVAVVMASRYAYDTYRIFQDIKKKGVHGTFSIRIDDDNNSVVGDDRSETSSVDNGPTMSPLVLDFSPHSSTSRDPSMCSRDSTNCRVTDCDDLTVDLKKLTAKLTEDIDAIIWKRILRLSFFIAILYVGAIGSAVGDAILCVQISHGKEHFVYSSPPCSTIDVFRYDSYMSLSFLFYIAVCIYIPPRHKKISDTDTTEDTSDAVLRMSEHGGTTRRTDSSFISVAF